MILNLEIINPITYPRWDELITSTKNYSFFHTSAWAQVLSENYGYTPLYFTNIENGTLQVAFPIMEVKSFLTGTRGVSLPFTDYCEPILTDNNNPEDIFNYLVEYGTLHGWHSIETRGWDFNAKNNSYASPCYVHSLSLTANEENLFNGFRDSTQRNIKKAIHEGVTVLIDTSYEAIRDFYRLNCITRQTHGLPPQPFSFFDNILSCIISKNQGVIIRAYYNKKCIAAAIFFHCGKKALYKYGASDKTSLHTRANNLIMWEAIKRYCEDGFTDFSLGITEPDNTGLMQFKNGWTKNTRTIVRQKYNIKKKRYMTYRSHVKGFHNIVFNKLPISVSKSVGAFFYKHIG